MAPHLAHPFLLSGFPHADVGSVPGAGTLVTCFSRVHKSQQADVLRSLLEVSFLSGLTLMELDASRGIRCRHDMFSCCLGIAPCVLAGLIILSASLGY